MNSKNPLYQVPVPSTEFEGATRLSGNILYFQYYRDRVLYRSGIRFSQMPATRTRAERCCTAWHVEGVYDTLAEVQGSSWVEEIRGATTEHWRNEWEMHHYMIYLDSAGCFEVIAASWDVLQEEAGLWSWPKM